MNQNGISIVIPAFNEEKFLPDTLQSISKACHIFEEEFHFPTETIVVDNASTDSTKLVATGLGARVISHSTRNIASVRNAGIKTAAYDLVITVDADSYVPANTFREIWLAMETGRYIGGGVRLGIRSDSLRLKIFMYGLEKLMVTISGLSGGMFFFLKGAALEIGGFPEAHLVAEDMTFAKTLRAYGVKRGKKFHNLRTVQILTFDRKDVSFWKTLRIFYVGLRAYMGAKMDKKELEYWYNPKR